MGSAKFNISQQEVDKWAKDSLIFSSPAILAFLLSLQSSSNLKFALGAFFSVLLSSLIGFMRTFLKDTSTPSV